MDSQMACLFLYGLFGPNSDPAPVWGNQQTLALLSNALDTGLSISDTKSTTGQSEASHAMETAVGWLQKSGKVPFDLQKVSGLSDEQRVALGFEPASVASNPAASVQDMGVPPFKNLDMAMFLAALRFVARYQQMKVGSKPVFQVGVLTLTVQGMENQFFAQILASEAGEATDTVWLYRWCVLGLDGEYEEHWRPFNGPVGVNPHPPAVVPQQQPIIHNPTDNVNARKRSHATSEPSAPQAPFKKTRQQRHQHFHHAQFSDAELFASPSELIQGDAILRLAHSYSNQDIFNRINAGKAEGTGVKSVNVITKRLSHAVEVAAKTSGKSEQEIRAEMSEAKRARGVRHKGKIDVTPYG